MNIETYLRHGNVTKMKYFVYNYKSYYYNIEL